MAKFRLAIFFLCNFVLFVPAQARPHQQWVELMMHVVEFSTSTDPSATKSRSDDLSASEVSSESASDTRALSSLIQFNKTIPAPEEFLGYELGSKHIRHDELVSYVTLLSTISPRFHLLEIGKTFEGRKLLTVVVAKPPSGATVGSGGKQQAQESLAAAALLRKQWLESEPGVDAFKNQVPSVAYFAYGVHGNEASPSNAVMLLLYLLAASEGDWIDGILDQSIVLVDPCLNPDGYDRFVQWLRNNQGTIVSSDPSDREHNETSPSSRTNHFGFDLNRDWLPATQPETRSRLKIYYEWLPNLVLDLHEMGASQSLFFQPGIEGRDHPATPPFVRDTTRQIAQNFSALLDDVGERHFTNQRFDDFYPGKGSTFPDLHGGVGILIEQGSSAGLIQNHGEGRRTFAETVANPLRLSIAALSSLQREHRSLMEYQRQFYLESRNGDFKTDATSRPSVQSILVRIPEDKRIAKEWIKTLAIHQIEMFQLSKTETIEGIDWIAEATWIIPVKQSESRFLKAMIDRQKDFAFSKFYDVSAWSIADAFGLDWVALDKNVALGPKIRESHISKAKLEKTEKRTFKQIAVECSVMSVDSGKSVDGMALMQALTKHSLPVRISSSPIELNTPSDDAFSFSAGSLFLLKADVIKSATPKTSVIQVDQADVWAKAIETFDKFCSDHGFDAMALQGGLSKAGIDLGSSDLERLQLPRVGIVLDDESNTNSAGSLWYVFDQVFQWPVVRVDRSALDWATLRRLDVLVFPDSNKSSLKLKNDSALQSWLLGGGHLIAIGSSVFDAQRIVKQIDIPVVEDDFARVLPDSKFSKFPDLQVAKSDVPGVLFRANLVRENFKTASKIAKNFSYTQQGSLCAMDLGSTDPSVWRPIAKLHESSWLAGYLPEEDNAMMVGRSVIAQGFIGDGTVTLMPFDPTFRGYSWDAVSILKAILLSH